jgi:hypothetical protein
MRRYHLVAVAVAVALTCGTAAARDDGSPYATLQQAGTPFRVARAAPPAHDVPLPVMPGEMKIQPFDAGYHDSPHLIAAQAQAPAGGAPGAEGGAGGAGGGQDDNGTNPAQNATTFIATNEFFHIKGDNNINTTYARLKFPIYDKRGSVLLEIPFVHYDLRGLDPRLPQVGGLGDIKIQGSFNTWTSESKKLTLIHFLEFYIPSADNALVGRVQNPNEFIAFNLGTGKYVLGPGLGFVYAIRPNFIFAPLYFYEASVAGDPNRAMIRRGKFRIFAMYALPSGLYALPEFQAVTNYFNGNTDFYFAPEIGYSHKRTTIYVKPGFGIDAEPGDRLWGIEFGARVMF